MKRVLLSLSFFVFHLLSIVAQDGDEHLPLGPTMGWSSWNTYGVNINEALIKRQADAMVSKGLKAVATFFGFLQENSRLFVI